MKKSLKTVLFHLLSAAFVLLNTVMRPVDAHALTRADAGLSGLSIERDDYEGGIAQKASCTHSDHKKIRAARICQRYHERLLTFMVAPTLTQTAGHNDIFPTERSRTGSAYYNKICLSSCYDYIFRLFPF